MIISIIGSGGKTTRMKQLLHQYKERNLPLVESINEPDSISEDLSE